MFWKKKKSKKKVTSSMLCFNKVLTLLLLELDDLDKMSRREIIGKVDDCLVHLKLLNMPHIRRGIDSGKIQYEPELELNWNGICDT